MSVEFGTDPGLENGAATVGRGFVTPGAIFSGLAEDAQYIRPGLTLDTFTGSLREFWHDEHGSTAPLARAQSFTELGPIGLELVALTSLAFAGFSTYLSTMTSAQGFSGDGNPVNQEAIGAAAGLNVLELIGSLALRSSGTTYLSLAQEAVRKGADLDAWQKAPAIGILATALSCYVFDIYTTYAGLEHKIPNSALRMACACVLSFGSELSLASAENSHDMATNLRRARANFKVT